MTCCASDEALASDTPVCCITIAGDTTSPTLPARDTVQPATDPATAPAQPVVIAQPRNASPIHPALALPDHGTRRHLVLCQFLI